MEILKGLPVAQAINEELINEYFVFVGKNIVSISGFNSLFI